MVNSSVAINNSCFAFHEKKNDRKLKMKIKKTNWASVFELELFFLKSYLIMTS